MSDSTNPRTTHDGDDAYPGPPRWGKVFGILFAIVVATIVLLHLTGHNPGARLHGGASETSGESPQP